MAQQPPSSSVILADNRSVAYAVLGQFSDYLSEYDKVSTYQHMPSKSLKDLESVYGADALKPIAKLQKSRNPEEQALAKEKLRQLNTLSQAMLDRNTFDGNVTVLGLDPDVVKIAKGVKNPALKTRIDAFNLGGHRKDEGMPDMWDAVQQDGIRARGDDFRQKLFSKDYQKHGSPKPKVVFEGTITPLKAEGYADELHSEITGQVMTSRLEAANVDYGTPDKYKVFEAINADESIKKTVLQGKVTPQGAWNGLMERMLGKPPEVREVRSEGEFYRQMMEDALDKSGSVEQQRAARAEYVRQNPPHRPPPKRPDVAAPEAPKEKPKVKKDKSISDMS